MRFFVTCGGNDKLRDALSTKTLQNRKCAVPDCNVTTIGYLQKTKTTEARRMGGAEKLSLKDLLRRSEQKSRERCVDGGARRLQGASFCKMQVTNTDESGQPSALAAGKGLLRILETEFFPAY